MSAATSQSSLVVIIFNCMPLGVKTNFRIPVQSSPSSLVISSPAISDTPILSLNWVNKSLSVWTTPNWKRGVSKPQPSCVSSPSTKQNKSLTTQLIAQFLKRRLHFKWCWSFGRGVSYIGVVLFLKKESQAKLLSSEKESSRCSSRRVDYRGRKQPTHCLPRTVKLLDYLSMSIECPKTQYRECIHSALLFRTFNWHCSFSMSLFRRIHGMPE